MLIFASVQALPGDVAQVVLGRDATAEQVAQVQEDLGLDEPIVRRYVDWLGDFVTGDLGNSTAALAQGREDPVSEAIADPLRNSLVLAGITVVLFIPLSLFLGALSAVRAGRPSDYAISTVVLSVAAMPEFLIGTLLVIVFFSELDLLPPIAQIPPSEGPLSNVEALVLPVLTLLGVNLAYAIRLVRATTLDVLGQNFVAIARLNGISERRVIIRYALRNALAPNVQVLAATVRYLIGGIIITESVFAYPGIGNELVAAVAARDIQMVSVIALILAALYVAANTLADLAVILLVPKLRTRGA